VSWPALDGALSAQEIKSLAHILQSVPAAPGGRAIRAGAGSGRIKTAPVVLDDNFEPRRREPHVHPDAGGVAMLQRVVERLLERQE
jgi:hypothetical protein